MENFEERYNELQHLSKVNYLKAEEEIQKYLRNELTQIQKLKLEIELANCFWLNSKLDEAEKLFSEILETSQNLNLKKENAEALVGLGTLDKDSGNFDSAVQRLEQAIAIFRSLNDKSKEAFALNRLAIIRYSQGLLDEAKRLFKRVLKLAEKSDETIALNALNNIAIIEEDRGNIEESVEIYKYCTERATEIEFLRGILIFGNNYAGSLRLIGEYSQAKKIYERTLKFAEKMGDIRNIALTCEKYATLCIDTGDFSKAEYLFEQSKVFYEEIDDKFSHINMLENYAKLWLRTGKIKKAKELLNQAQNLMFFSGINLPETNILTMLAEIYHREKNNSEAYKILKKANEIAWKLKSDIARAKVLLERARINVSQYDLWEAEFLIKEAYKLTKKSKHIELRFQTLIFLAEVGLLRYKEDNNDDASYSDAIKYINQARNLALEKGLMPFYINASIVHAMLYTVKFQFDKAESLLSESMQLAESRGLAIQAQRARERLNFILNNVQNLQKEELSDKILFSITLEEIQQIISQYTEPSIMEEDRNKIFIVSYKIDDNLGPLIHAVDNIDITDQRYTQQIKLVGSLYPVSLGHGREYHTGLFGPYPFGTSNLKALVYSLTLFDHTQKKTRNKGITFFLICIIYPDEISPIFYDQQKLESLIEMQLKTIREVDEITPIFLSNLRQLIIQELMRDFG
ncbi:MAG: tetratricopeptide repeat protein [Candidatus Lokiarchaeota archaeon]|nr:tetratricopeptide repeat protein [Candidatus Harpocratesius repetitus]